MTHKLYLIVGPSGTGKTSLSLGLAKKGIPEVVSHTSRSPREGETHGVDYWFVSHDEFDDLVTRGSMLEHVTYSGSRYGTTRIAVANKLLDGPACIVVEAGGAAQLQAALPGWVVTLFLEPPPLDELRRRMLARGDKPETIEKRLSTVELEAAAARPLADFVLAPAPPETLLDEALKIIDCR